MFSSNSNNRRTMKSILLVKKRLGLVEMTSRLVNASFCLPNRQAVKMTFFAPWPAKFQTVTQNAWDFCLVMDRFSENVPATSEDFRWLSEGYRMLPKKPEDVLTNFDHFEPILCVLISLGHRVIIQCLIGTFLGKVNWIFLINHVLKSNLFRFVSQVWEIVLDGWDRCL